MHAERRRRSPERAIEDLIVFKNPPFGGVSARENRPTVVGAPGMPPPAPRGGMCPTGMG